MFCPKCGAEGESDGRFCQNCGIPLNERPEAPTPAAAEAGPGMDSQMHDGSVYSMISQKDKGILILLACFGSLGLDRFYRGQTVFGVLKLLTAGGCGIWSFIDLWCYILGKLVQDSDGKYIVDKKTLDLIRNG
jgi:TM2 domain-containing membrane protein YozV